MKTIDLHNIVAAAIGEQWDAFAQGHPQLAAALDRNLLIQHAAQSVRDDPQFADALAGVQAQGAQQQKLQTLVAGVVRRVMGLIRDN